MSDSAADVHLTSGPISGDWLVVGWFTPDYYKLAAHFSANLTEHGIPFHLWLKPKLGKGWNTLRKPSVVLETMDAYPGKTLVLMDVDCRVNGDIAPATEFSGDVAITIFGRWVRLFWPPHKRLTMKVSSRVVVFRPTEGARIFAQEWERQCKIAHYSGDEVAMGRAFLRGLQGVSFAHLNSRYSANDALGSDMVGHESAHAAMFPKPSDWLKAIEKRVFRTGRTKRAKAARLSAP
ncbi:MAG TPA: hypothetical protein VGF29_07725 [Hyphomicrobiaceae bacterium]|jgi:hypothetical protein